MQYVSDEECRINGTAEAEVWDEGADCYSVVLTISLNTGETVILNWGVVEGEAEANKFASLVGDTPLTYTRLEPKGA